MSLQPTTSRLSEPVPHECRAKSCGPTVITAAAISAGGSSSRVHCVYPRYDGPMVANVPVNQGCATSQATTSCPSARSVRIGSKSPSEAAVPRLDTKTTW